MSLSEKNILSNILFLIVFLIINSCKSGNASNYKYNEQFENILKIYTVGDTLVFANDKLKSYDTFMISSIDTIVNKESKMFTSSSVSREIYVRYRQLPENHFKRKWYEQDPKSKELIQKEGDDFLIAVTYYKDTTSDISIQFKSFSESYLNKLPEVEADRLRLDDSTVTDYMILNSQRATEIRKIYFDNKKGIVGYESSNNDTWIRVK